MDWAKRRCQVVGQIVVPWIYKLGQSQQKVKNLMSEFEVLLTFLLATEKMFSRKDLVFVII